MSMSWCLDGISRAAQPSGQLLPVKSLCSRAKASCKLRKLAMGVASRIQNACRNDPYCLRVMTLQACHRQVWRFAFMQLSRCALYSRA